MSYIAYLDSAANGTLQGERWQVLARTAGAPLRDFGGPAGDVAKVVDFIREASGFVLPYENFLLTNETAEAITQSVLDGRRVFVSLGPNSIGRLNPWLKPFGLSGTTIALHDPAGGRLIRVD